MQSEPQAAHYLGGTEFSHSVDEKQALPKTGLEGYGICFRSYFALYMLGNFWRKIRLIKLEDQEYCAWKKSNGACVHWIQWTWSENIVGWIGVMCPSIPSVLSSAL